jgi:hypothetical protein
MLSSLKISKSLLLLTGTILFYGSLSNSAIAADKFEQPYFKSTLQKSLTACQSDTNCNGACEKRENARGGEYAACTDYQLANSQDMEGDLIGFIWDLFYYVAWGINWCARHVLQLILFMIQWCIDTAYLIPSELKETVWVKLRDFVNLVVAAALVAGAVMNILQVKVDSYGVKKMLPLAIVGLAAINLSWFICALMLDLGRVAMELVLNIDSGLEYGIYRIADDDALALGTRIGAKSAQKLTKSYRFLWEAITVVVYYMLIMSLSQLLFVMFVRIIVIWMLFAVSPLAWLGFVVPEVRAQTWGKFWEALVTMIFLPARVMLYIAIGLMMRDSYAAFAEKNPASTQALAGVSEMAKQITETGEGGENNFFIKAVIMFAISVFCVKKAAEDAMKNEYTGAAMEYGKVFGGYARKLAGTLPAVAWKASSSGIKYGANKLFPKSGGDKKDSIRKQLQDKLKNNKVAGAIGTVSKWAGEGFVEGGSLEKGVVKYFKTIHEGIKGAEDAAADVVAMNTAKVVDATSEVGAIAGFFIPGLGILPSIALAGSGIADLTTGEGILSETGLKGTAAGLERKVIQNKKESANKRYADDLAAGGPELINNMKKFVEDAKAGDLDAQIALELHMEKFAQKHAKFADGDQSDAVKDILADAQTAFRPEWHGALKDNINYMGAQNSLFKNVHRDSVTKSPDLKQGFKRYTDGKDIYNSADFDFATLNSSHGKILLDRIQNGAAYISNDNGGDISEHLAKRFYSPNPTDDLNPEVAALVTYLWDSHGYYQGPPPV